VNPAPIGPAGLNPVGVNPDETVQLRFAPGGPPGWPPPTAPNAAPPPPQQHRQSPVHPPAIAPVGPAPADPPRAWWAFLPTLIWLAAAAFTVGALIALS